MKEATQPGNDVCTVTLTKKELEAIQLCHPVIITRMLIERGFKHNFSEVFPQLTGSVNWVRLPDGGIEFTQTTTHLEVKI